MLLFMATYLVSYLTRVNYAAVVTEIADAEGMLRSVAAPALTGGAVTYGVRAAPSADGSATASSRAAARQLGGLLTTICWPTLLIPLCGTAYQMAAVSCVRRACAGVYVAAAASG